MRYIFVFISLLWCSGALRAQGTQIRPTLAAGHCKLVDALLQPQNSSNAVFRGTTGITMERLIAQSVRNNTSGSLTDSVNLRYTQFRGSAYDFNSMIYAYNYPYSTSPMFTYAGIFTKPKILFDTLYHWEVDPNTLVYGPYETGYATYDAGNNLKSYKSFTIDSVVYPNMLYANRFTTAGNIDTAFGSTLSMGIADSAFKQFFTYTATGKISRDSTYERHLGTWRLASKSVYTYNTGDDLIQIDNYANTTDTSFLLPLVEQVKYVNTYDASHRLVTVNSSFFNGTTLSPYVKDTFAYSGTTTYHNTWKEYQWDAINGYWAPMFYMYKTINLSTGLPDTVRINGFDSLANSWIPQTLEVMSYNSFNDPVTLKEYDYNFVSFPTTPNFTTTYYYQTFINNAAVPASPGDGLMASVFPNPATNQITVTGLDIASGSPIVISLINGAGQFVSRESRPTTKDPVISVAGLPPGLYELMIQNAAGQVLCRQRVVKE